MFATIRRYDGVDQNRSAELTRKVNETLVPKLEKGRARWLLADRGRQRRLQLAQPVRDS